MRVPQWDCRGTSRSEHPQLSTTVRHITWRPPQKRSPCGNYLELYPSSTSGRDWRAIARPMRRCSQKSSVPVSAVAMPLFQEIQASTTFEVRCGAQIVAGGRFDLEVVNRGSSSLKPQRECHRDGGGSGSTGFRAAGLEANADQAVRQHAVAAHLHRRAKPGGG